MKKLLSLFLMFNILFISFPNAICAISDTGRLSTELITDIVKTDISDKLWEENQISANFIAYSDIQLSPVSISVINEFCVFSFSSKLIGDIIVEIYSTDGFEQIYFDSVSNNEEIKIPKNKLTDKCKFLFKSKYNAFSGNFIFNIENNKVFVEDDYVYFYSVNDIDKYIQIIDTSIETISSKLTRNNISDENLFNSVLKALPAVSVISRTMSETETNNGTANADNLSEEVLFNYTVVGTITYDPDDTFQEADVFRNIGLPFSANIEAKVENTSNRNRITAEFLTGTGTVVTTGTQSSASSDLYLSSDYNSGSNFYIRIKLEPFYVTNNPETNYAITFGISLKYESALDVVRSSSAPTSFTGYEDTDCYNYVNRNPNSTYNVGGYHGVFTEDFTSVSMIVNYFMEDCYEMTGSYPVSVGDPNTYSGNIPEGSYLIALFTGILQTSYAYHFYLQGSNKTWSHTYPGKDILYKDGCEFRDITIYNPIYSCRYVSHYYDNFIGFYLISSYVD